MPPLAGILAARDETDTLNTELPEFSVQSERSMSVVRQQTTDPRSNHKPDLHLQVGTPVNLTSSAGAQYARGDEALYLGWACMSARRHRLSGKYFFGTVEMVFGNG